MNAQEALNELNNRPKNTLQGDEWKPTEEGEHIVGEVHSYGEKQTRFGPSTLLSIWDTDGARRDIWCNSVLEGEIEDAGGVKQGDTVAIRYDGQEDVGKGNPAKVFSFVKIEETSHSKEFEPKA